MSDQKFLVPIPNEYGGGLTVMMGPAPKPERDWEAENAARMAARFDAAAIVRRYGLSSAEDIDAHLRAFGFPPSLGMASRVKHLANGAMLPETRVLYDNVKVTEWEDSVLQLADTIRKARR